MVERIGYIEFLKTDDPESAEGPRGQRARTCLEHPPLEEENPESTLADFLEEVSLITDIDNYDNEAIPSC